MRPRRLKAVRSTALLLVLAAALAACGPGGDDARKAVTSAVQQAAPAARGKDWHGTVTVHITASGAFSDPLSSITEKADHWVDLAHTVNLDVNGAAQASIDYQETSKSDFREDYDFYTITGNEQLVIAASGPSADARVDIEIYPDGRYTVDYFAQGIDGTGHRTGSSAKRCKQGRDPGCLDDDNSTDETYPVTELGYVSGGVEGQVDSKHRYVLSGTHSEPYLHGEHVSGQTVVSWTLER